MIQAPTDYDQDRVSAHFTMSEVRCHCGECDGNVTVDPTLLDCLEHAREVYDSPIHINSWCRCPKHNRDVGGKSDSVHLTGQAVDLLVGGSRTRFKLKRALYAAGFTRIGNGSMFIHADVCDSKDQEVEWNYKPDATAGVA